MARRDEGAYPKVRDRGATKTAGMDRRPGVATNLLGTVLRVTSHSRNQLLRIFRPSVARIPPHQLLAQGRIVIDPKA